MDEPQEQKEQKEQLPDIKLTITVSHYFTHTKARGQRFSVVGKDIVEQIVTQPDWEKVIYFEHLENVSRMWLLEDWLFYKQNNMEMVRETKLEDIKNASNYHKELEAWKLSVRTQLRKAGKLNEKQIESVIIATVAPATVKDFEIRNKVVAKYPFNFKD